MLYPKNRKKTLSPTLFANPTAEYRGTPFWAWNGQLEKNELLRQISIFKKMGFGGFHMHVRYGMATPYLSEEFLDLTRACVEEAKRLDMLAWLYDEDRYPSGFAGGLVTGDPARRAKRLYLSTAPKPQKTESLPDELLARFDVCLDGEGNLTSYRMLARGEVAQGRLLYAYLRTLPPSPRFNDTAYVDTLSKEAIDLFIESTHEKFKATVGEDFGGAVPAIFTDEPQYSIVTNYTLDDSLGPVDMLLPFTTDLDESFKSATGKGLIAAIPELIWQLKDGISSPLRYQYFDHLTERFVNAFADNIGAWCKKNGIALTGHVMAEPTLGGQTHAVGEAMRSYRGFEIPGIDILCNKYEFTTAKQAQSAKHQYGREAMLSELYGVTGWDNDFRGHKMQGDWQAALGVTVRVPHLSWYSMKGGAKRDYPASFHYHSPWYGEYHYVEDHYARLNTALTRGKPVVHIGVIHPIESNWLNDGPEDKTGAIREDLGNAFKSVTSWLLFGTLDFDYICESTLPALCPVGGAPLQVGEMAYDAVVIPPVDTLRRTTLDRLQAFTKAGGRLIVMGDIPKHVDGVRAHDAAEALADAVRISPTRAALLAALAPYRTVSIKTDKGKQSGDMIYALRNDGEGRWLFVTKAVMPYNKDISNADKRLITVKGRWQATLYDTLTGEVRPYPVTLTGDATQIEKIFYPYDSLLLYLTPATDEETASPTTAKQALTPLCLPSSAAFTLHEPNALLLDMAEYAVDGGAWHPVEEMMRANDAIREMLGLRVQNGDDCQPWCLSEETPTHTVSLRFTVESEVDLVNVALASEIPDTAQIQLDGCEVANIPCGYYVDIAIKRVALPPITRGTHTLVLTLPYGERSTLEWCYLLGGFGVRVTGREKRLCALPERLGFSTITAQGLPFYSGKLSYHLPVSLPEDAQLQICVPQYRAATVLASLDGGEPVQLSLSPYLATLPAGAGTHTLTLDLYINRTNGFGPVHMTDRRREWLGAGTWRTKNDAFAYEYTLSEQGLLTAPQCRLVKE
ncbi:MAG: hypothetical protein E7650_00080 [Ruminococcaceae bacterium]|nr:hypothetical protein [Oscillospiraceae bacterium]